MKPLLVIGLGNPLMGDDGIGCVVAERLANNPRLPSSVEVICGGPDLLRYAAQMEGRRAVIMIDAIEDEAEPGTVAMFDGADAALDDHQTNAHHLSAVQAIRLLESISSIRCTLFGISVSSVKAGVGLSPWLEHQVPAILDCLVEELGRRSRDDFWRPSVWSVRQSEALELLQPGNRGLIGKLGGGSETLASRRPEREG